MRRGLLCTLEDAEGEHRLLEELEELEEPEVMRCVLLCTLEAVEISGFFYCGSFLVTMRVVAEFGGGFTRILEEKIEIIPSTAEDLVELGYLH